MKIGDKYYLIEEYSRGKNKKEICLFEVYIVYLYNDSFGVSQKKL